MLLKEEHDLLASAQDMEPIKQFVVQSLTAKSKGDSFFYDNICKQLRDRDDPEMYWKVLIALSSYVSLFSRDPGLYADLVNDIFTYDWRQDRKISIAFINLVGHMVSSNATFIYTAFHALVARLVPTDWEIEKEKSTQAANAEKDDNETQDVCKEINAPGRSTEDNIKAIRIGKMDTGAIVSSSSRTATSSGTALPPMPGYKPEAMNKDLSEAHVENLQERAYRIHRAIISLIHLAPSGQAKLMNVLEEKFPHKRFSDGIISFYVAQVFYICEYLPALQQRVLDMVIQHALEIDVEIVIEDSGEVTIQEEYKGEDEENIFQLDDAGTSNLTASAKKKKFEAAQRIPDAVSEMADKLDSVLALVVAHIDRQLVKETLFKERLYQQLLSILEERVLFTYRSKFVQFIYFYVGSRVERFAVAFCQRLLRVYLETGHSSIKLQSAVLYLASFMARANFVPVSVVADNVTSLLMWANEYITQIGADTPFSRTVFNRANGINVTSLSNVLSKSESLASLNGGKADGNIILYKEFDDMGRRTSEAVQSTLSRHETFFCCMQAVSYVLCFYGTELAMSIKADETRRLQWERVVASELNPLKYCLESVRGEFLRLAHCVGMFSAECWSMLPSAVEYNNGMTAVESTAGDESDAERRSRSASSIGAAVTSDSAAAGHYNSIIAAVVSIPLDDIVRTSDAKQVLPKVGASAVRPIGSPGSHVPQKVPVMGTGNNPLESFFPFDPCLLRKMHEFIEASYRGWRGVPGLDPGAEFDYEHDEAAFEQSDNEDSDTDAQDEGRFVGLSGVKRERANTVSSQASSSLVSQSEGMDVSTPGVSNGRYMNSYLSELANDQNNSGIAYSSGGQGSGLRHLREGFSRHGSAVSANSQQSQESNIPDANAEAVWPMPIPRPRLYSVGSTGSW